MREREREREREDRVAEKRREYLYRGERKNDCGDGWLNEKEMLGFRFLDLNN